MQFKGQNSKLIHIFVDLVLINNFYTSIIYNIFVYVSAKAPIFPLTDKINIDECLMKK